MNTSFADFESMLEQSRAAFGPVAELGELSAKTLEELTRQQLEAAGDYVEFGMQQAELFGKIRSLSDVSDVVAGQTRLATELAGKVKSRAESFAKTAADAQQAYSNLLTTAFQVPAVAAAPKARKKAA